ncbi:restriction endonuclease subunit S [Segatella sp.]|uniref:restriction endonuclease subunit S n=1 Tax=Segatella sp. TaxID=2974253 RepID=UPI0030795B4E
MGGVSMVLSDLVDVIGGGTPKTTEESYWNGSIPWLSVKDFCGDKKYVYNTEKSITVEGLNNSSTKLLHKDNIIISARGTVGELAMIPYDMAFNQSCFGLIPKGNNDPHFVYYLLKDKVRSLKSQTQGSVFDTITKATFGRIECADYSEEDQRRIASILSSLDRKIELNNKINADLEEMAQAIFKNWFVDFEPFKDGKFVDSELGMMPEGWKVGRLTDVIKLMPGGTPKTSEPLYWDNGTIPFFSPKDVNGVYCFATEKHITEAGLNKCSSNLYPKDTIFITCRGTVGKVCLVACDMAMNQSNYAIKAIDGYSQYYVFFLVKSVVERLIKKSNGAVFSAITSKDFDEEILIPSQKAVEDFTNVIDGFFRRIFAIGTENSRLSLLRDTLLPRLMSGELEVPE